MKNYEFTFENGVVYYGTVEDKNEVFTSKERKEMGKIVSKKEVTAEFVENWRTKAMAALGI